MHRISDTFFLGGELLARLRTYALISALFLFAAAPVAAIGNLDNILTIAQEGLGSMTLSGADLGCIIDEEGGKNGQGSFACQGIGQSLTADPALGTWQISNWQITGEFDPSVSQAFGFTNLGAPAVFTIVTSSPVAPILGASLMGGSTGGSTTDANFDGLGGVSTSAPDPFFTGLIDGVAAAGAALHPDPFSTAPYPAAGGTVNIPSTSFGLPGPTVPGPAVTTSIGIQNKFSLSGGDSIASTNAFIVEVIPEPSTALLLGVGLAALAARRRTA